MAKLYVFGIGGTGARVLRSFTMMMAAGVNIGADEIVPVIIDPDASNADLTRTVALMNIYRSIRSSLSFSPQNESTLLEKNCHRFLRIIRSVSTTLMSYVTICLNGDCLSRNAERLWGLPPEYPI